MLTPVETLLLLNEIIFKFDNTNSTILIKNFYNNFSFLAPFLHEYGLYDVDFARGVNSKLNIILQQLYQHPNQTIHIGSNIIPQNVSYDFFSRLHSQDIYNNYQLKMKLSNRNTFIVENLFELIEKYNVGEKNKNFLVLDNSFQNKKLQLELYNSITNNSYLNKLYINKKILIHNNNLVKLHIIENLNTYKKFLLLIK